jgi:hypothetical protein
VRRAGLGLGIASLVLVLASLVVLEPGCTRPNPAFEAAVFNGCFVGEPGVGRVCRVILYSEDPFTSQTFNGCLAYTETPTERRYTYAELAGRLVTRDDGEAVLMPGGTGVCVNRTHAQTDTVTVTFDPVGTCPTTVGVLTAGPFNRCPVPEGGPDLPLHVRQCAELAAQLDVICPRIEVN